LDTVDIPPRRKTDTSAHYAARKLCISIYFDRFMSFLDICTFVRLSYFAEPSIYFLVMTVHSVRMGVRIRVVEIETSQHTVGMWKTPAVSKLEMSRRGEGSVRGGGENVRRI